MGTYSSLLHLGKLRKREQPVFEAAAALLNAPTDKTASPVAPSPRPSISMDQTEPVGESPRRPVTPTPRRPLQRAAFDIYEDQVQAIKRLKNKRQLELDRDVSKSEIVREALEHFFKSLT